ncbi:hypothetical protein PSAR109036_04510 [Psychrobacter arenosus]|uniref:HD domain-containing protein n=1 Tax=Psychrobacter arenosus TaxID=256326 RepID=UPI00191900B8|nr:hypothetical protein [Psychrobacter arenosus]
MAQTLKSRFTDYLQALSPDLAMADIEPLWLDIEQRYTEPQRAYHTLAHLKFIFAQFTGISESLRQPSLVALALFYHDVIYHMGDKPATTVAPKSNEALSADHAAAQLKDWLNPEQIERIYELILLTESHQLSDTTDSDAAYLLDLDLSVLGASWSTYQRYAQAVRFEYQHVPIKAYRLGRAAVLQHLLSHPSLYMTERFYTQYEESARANIARELHTL